MSPTASLPRPSRWPKALKAGDRIGIVSPAGPADAEYVRHGKAILESWGYEVEIAPHALDREDYLAGSDAERRGDLVEALCSDRFDALICSRGGYGSLRLLRDLPWDDLAASPPKAFVGFSDIGGLQLNLWHRAGWITYSGLQAAHGLGEGSATERSAAHFRGWLDGSGRRFGWPGESEVILGGDNVVGTVEGPMVPVCLSILAALAGTPWMPDLTESIVVLEETGEAPYRIDRMIWQLRDSGALDKLRALVLGCFLWQGRDIAEDARRIVCEHFPSLPVYSGLPYGHRGDRFTLPVGATVQISEGRMTLVGDAV